MLIGSKRSLRAAAPARARRAPAPAVDVAHGVGRAEHVEVHVPLDPPSLGPARATRRSAASRRAQLLRPPEREAVAVLAPQPLGQRERHRDSAAVVVDARALEHRVEVGAGHRHLPRAARPLRDHVARVRRHRHGVDREPRAAAQPQRAGARGHRRDPQAGPAQRAAHRQRAARIGDDEPSAPAACASRALTRKSEASTGGDRDPAARAPQSRASRRGPRARPARSPARARSSAASAPAGAGPTPRAAAASGRGRPGTGRPAAAPCNRRRAGGRPDVVHRRAVAGRARRARVLRLRCPISPSARRCAVAAERSDQVGGAGRLSCEQPPIASAAITNAARRSI